MDVSVDLNTGERYRIFAHVGNSLSENGVTVTAQILEPGISFEFSFWTRKDAETFFTHLAFAAQATLASEDDELLPGRTMMAEDVTTAWEDLPE